MSFTPDYRNFLSVMKNERPARLPLYEHHISANVMQEIIGGDFADLYRNPGADLPEYFRNYCKFHKDMTYDVVSYEKCITEVLGGGALCGGKVGPIQSREDFEAFPWDEIPEKFWERATPRFDALVASLPEGMKAVGGIGNGVFEISEDLVGLEHLPFMQMDYPDLYADLYKRIGDLMCTIWEEFLKRYSSAFVACRFGDDLGFRSSLLTNPATIREHVLPQYKRVIDMVHGAGVPFMLHSCGCIFEVMDDIIDLGIDAKHSNEDSIAPFDKWIEDYSGKIGLVGGFDMDFLCSKTEQEVFDAVLTDGKRFRGAARGYALGSGNSIPDYVPTANYLAMVRATQQIRSDELR